MNGYAPSWATGTGESSTPLLQIAEYLSERGIAVLRYNKRGVGINSSLLDRDVFMNNTIQTLIQNAEVALEVLMEQGETDANDVTIIGHSEGSIIATRIACANPCVKKIILLGAIAHNLRDLLEYQVVERKVAYLDEVIDRDKDGLISINEVISYGDSNIFLPVPDFTLIENISGEWQWPLGIDSNEDGLLSIFEEYAPRNYNYLDMVTKSEYPTSIWFRSHFELDSTLNVIGNLSCSILILNGEDDVQTPVQEAYLLEQRLLQGNHPDHKLISYPGLGHTFYPIEGWIQPLGPIQDYVLSDIYSWLRDPVRNLQYFYSEQQASERTIDEIQIQLSELNSENTMLNLKLNTHVGKIQNLEKGIEEVRSKNSELQSTQILSRNLTYIALGLSLVIVALSLRPNQGGV
jgi:pimeloyl-ACP methyl ester carboxylesterase